MNLLGRIAAIIRWSFACVMLIVTPMGVHAKPDDRDLFKLCPPDERMRLIVERLDEHATKANLTERQIRNAAESRLRAAGLYDPDADPYLYVHVHAGPPETGSRHFPYFSIHVEYGRLLWDLRLSWFYFAATWDTGSTG